MRILILYFFLLLNMQYVLSQDSFPNTLSKFPPILLKDKDIIFKVEAERQFDFSEFLKLFAAPIAGGVTGLIALLGISRQIRNSQQLQRSDFTAKKINKLIEVYSELISEIDKSGVEGFKRISNQSVPTFFYKQKETELKMQIAVNSEDKNVYKTFFEILDFYKNNKLNSRKDIENWLNILEEEFRNVIQKII